MMQHRLILLVPHPENFAHDIDAFHDHWNKAHADFVFPVDQVRGYIQNRPVDNNWHWDRFHGVAELFFDNAQTEEQAWDSQPWVDGLAPDEHYLLDVENGWSSVVADEQVIRDGRQLGYRVLAFGGDASKLPAGAGEAREFTLEEAPPLKGASKTVVASYAQTEPEARAIAQALGGVPLIAHAVTLLEPTEVSR